MAGAGNIVLMWSVRACWVPAGAGQQGIPVAQSLAQNNDFGANGDYIVVPGNGSPTAANITTACTTLGANVALALGGTGAGATGVANLAVIDGWQNGTG